MAHPEDETYSVIFRSLRHPIRRKILRLLSDSPRGFSEIQEILKIESPHLTYHLESLDNLVSKTEDAKYRLSSSGKAAVDMMTNVEEPSEPAVHLQSSPNKWKAMLAVMLVGIVLLSGLCYLQYRTLTQLSDQYSSLREQLDVLKESLGVGSAVLTEEYSENGKVATAFRTKNQTGNGLVVIYEEPLWGHDVDWYRIYSLADNSTLEIEISITGSDLPAGAYLNMMIWKESRSSSSDLSNETAADVITSGVLELELWERVNVSGTYLKTLPSRGLYTIEVMAPGVWNMTDHYIMDYAVTLRVKAQDNLTPFLAEAQTQAFLLSESPDFFREYPWRPTIGDP